MAENIVKLRVDSKEYESKLERARQGLQHLENELQKIGQNYTHASKEQVQYVQALGQMGTVSQTVRGKIGEMTKTFTELAVKYKQLSDEEKASPFGQALSASLDQLRTRTVNAKRELEELNNELSTTQKGGGGGGLFSGDKLSGMLQVAGGNLMAKGVGLAASALSNLTSEISECVTQGIELAKQGEGIRNAFERLGRGDLLAGLREATHGTVTDLELMKAAVKFDDFKLPVEELGTMLAFAQQKAKDTGQSVDYMVDSIVTGLGRKSLMILDNLGLSAAEIKDKMAETGDMTKAVGAIIREQMSKAGDYVETAADRAAQSNVSLQNKMEELGRKFAPVEEASNQLWTSMKIAILDVVGGPLARLLNGLTEAGRLRNTLNDINGTGSDGQTHTGRALGALRHYSGDKQGLYNRQIARYNELESNAWRQANSLRTQLEGLRRQQRENGTAGNLSPFIADVSKQLERAENTAKAWQKMRSEYQKGAKDILKPATVDIDTSGAVQSVETLKVKLAELEAQRKKAVASGDNDRVKTLTQQINQTKTNIKALNPNALKTTHTVTPQERAASKVSEAERTYAETLLKNSIRLEAGIDTTLENKKKELSAQERLFDAYNDAYATYKDPKYKEASAAAAEKIKSLATEVKSMEDAVKASKVKWEQGLSGFNAQTMSAWMSGRQSDLSKAEYGSADYSGIMANIADMNAIKTVLEQSMKAGIDAAQFDLEPLWEKVFDGENIPDGTWQSMIDTINEKLKKLHLEPIQLDFQTGNVKSQAKEMAKDWQAAGSAIQAVGSAMSQIEDPAAKVMGTIAQAVATIALTFAESLKGTFTPWDWIAAAAAGTATMISTIAAIHSATAGGFANGGIVPGNSFSGDNLRTSDYGINSGELILNRAQQGNLVSQLNDARGVGQLEAVITGEQLRLVLNNNGRRTGRGEVVTTKFS